MVNTQTVTVHDRDNVSNDQLCFSIVKAVSNCSSNRGGQLVYFPILKHRQLYKTCFSFIYDINN